MFHQEESQNPLFIHDRERKNQHRDCIHTALLHTTTTCEDLMTGTWQPEQFSRLAASRNPRAQTSLSEPREIRFEFPPHRSEGSGVEAKLGSKNCPGARSVIADFVTKHRCCDYSRL
jgi:hypothetical protein